MSGAPTRLMPFRFLPIMVAMWDHSRPPFHGKGCARTGQGWNDAEKRHLLAGYQEEGLDIPALARRHERGPAGITAQLQRLLSDAPEVQRLYTQLRTWERNPDWDGVRRTPPQDPLVFEEWTALRNVGAAPSLAGRARAYADQMLSKRATPTCKGPNCGTTDPRFHSKECFAAHDAATAAWPVHNESIARAYLDGRKVEYFSHSKQKWVTFYNRGPMKAGDPKREWRLYTPPRVTVLGATVREVNGALMLVHSPLPDANLVLEFTDGELTAAKPNDCPF